MLDSSKQVRCEHCGEVYAKEDLLRDCGNCFACTGCEIYSCPNCREEIVVKPVRKMKGTD